MPAVQRLFVRLAFAAIASVFATTGLAQQIYGVPGSPSATTTIEGDQLPGAAAEVRRQDRTHDEGFEALLAGTRRAAEGCAQRAADHDRRFGLRRPQHLRRRHSDTGARPHRSERPALHELPFDGAVLADAGRADHRPQPSLGRLRRDLRAGDGLSRLRQLHHQGQGDDRQDPEGERLPHVVVRQEPQHAGFPGLRDGPVRPVADRHGLRVLLRLHGRRHQPVGAGEPRAQYDVHLSVPRQPRRTT